MNSVPATVLVIEAHPMMREALCSAIADEPGLKVAMQVSTVTQALQMIAIVPDIILLALGNFEQGDMDGLRTLYKSLPATPILALTSNEKSGQEQAALDNGAFAVQAKAAPRAELINTLRKLRTKAIMNHSEMYLEQEASGNSSQ